MQSLLILDNPDGRLAKNITELPQGTYVEHLVRHWLAATRTKVRRVRRHRGGRGGCAANPGAEKERGVASQGGCAAVSAGSLELDWMPGLCSVRRDAEGGAVEGGEAAASREW